MSESSVQRHQVGERSSKVVVYNNTAYLSGQVCEDPSQDISEQTKSTLARVDALLASVGTDKSRLLSTTIYLKNITDFATMNAVWNAWVAEGNPPARTCVEARMARDTLLVEITVVAACD